MSDRLWVATHKGLFAIDRAKRGGWRIERVSFLGDAVLQVHADARGRRVWAGLGLGHFGAKIRRSKDEGATWEDVGTPAYPAKPEGLVDKDGAGKEVAWRTEKIWAFASGGRD